MKIEEEKKIKYILTFTREELQVLWNKIVKYIEYDYPDEWWLSKSPVDEIEEFLILIKKRLVE